MLDSKNKGFIVIHRSITEWRWWKNNTARGLWLYLLIEANWKSGFNRDGLEIKRGQIFRSLKKIAEDNEVTINTIRYWLKKFEESGEISVCRTRQYQVINVINYAKYQDVGSVHHTTTDTKTDTTTDTKTDTKTDTDITKKQGNKKNKETNIEEDIHTHARMREKIDSKKFFRKCELLFEREKDVRGGNVEYIEEMKNTLKKSFNDITNSLVIQRINNCTQEEVTKIFDILIYAYDESNRVFRKKGYLVTAISNLFK